MRAKPIYKDKQQYQDLLREQITALSKLQDLLYADNRYALLLIFQAMDAAGKDSAIKHLMSGVNPQGCQVFSFKHPSAEELDHDFLWRTTRSLPERGRIGIFNRSYYEEVLIKNSPWYIVPADDKENARLILSEIILDALRGLPLRYPSMSPEHRKELLAIRKQLAK